MNLSLAFIEGIGGPELMMIMFIVLLLFGPKKLPELARGLGKSVREFKKATSGLEDEVRKAMEEPPIKAPSPAANTQQISKEETVQAARRRKLQVTSSKCQVRVVPILFLDPCPLDLRYFPT